MQIEDARLCFTPTVKIVLFPEKMLNALLLFAYTALLALAVGLSSRSRGFLNLVLGYSLVVAGAACYLVFIGVHQEGDSIPYVRLGDGVFYLKQAMALAEGDLNQSSHFLGYQLLLSFFFRLFGSELAVALAVNISFLILTLRVLYAVGLELFFCERTALACALLFAFTTDFIAYAINVIRDPLIAFSHAVLMLGLIRCLAERPRFITGVAMLGISLALLSYLRTTQLIFVAIVFGSVLFSFNRKSILYALLILLISIPVLPQLSSLTSYELSLDFVLERGMENTVIENRFARGDLSTDGVVGRASAFLSGLSPLLKFALFPLPFGIQFALPFNFWSATFISEHISYFFDRNLRVIWFLFVGPLFLYTILNARRIPDQLVFRFFVGGVLSYTLVAVVYGGAIPRYGSPMLIFAYPAMAYWLHSAWEGQSASQFFSFFARYYVFFSVLAGAYIFYIIRGLA